MAISVSVQVELVGEHPVLEVHSLISESILKASTITDVVPSEIVEVVLKYAGKELAKLAVNCGIPKETLLPITDVLFDTLTSEWRLNAAKEDFYLESGIPDTNGNTLWLITVDIIANCELDEKEDAEVPVELTKIPNNVH